MGGEGPVPHGLPPAQPHVCVTASRSTFEVRHPRFRAHPCVPLDEIYLLPPSSGPISTQDLRLHAFFLTASPHPRALTRLCHFARSVHSSSRTCAHWVAPLPVPSPARAHHVLMVLALKTSVRVFFLRHKFFLSVSNLTGALRSTRSTDSHTLHVS